METISGKHLLIDGYVEDGAMLQPATLCAVFEELVDRLGMEFLMRPVACRVSEDPALLDTDQDEGGWSVFCQITTSHLALHGWPLRNAFMADVFSCRDFDTDAAGRLLWRRLGVRYAVVHTIGRVDPRAYRGWSIQPLLIGSTWGASLCDSGELHPFVRESDTP